MSNAIKVLQPEPTVTPAIKGGRKTIIDHAARVYDVEFNRGRKACIDGDKCPEGANEAFVSGFAYEYDRAERLSAGQFN